MAWEYITYACGHGGREQLYGPVKNREWIAQKKAQGLCPECYKADLQRKRDEENRLSAEKNREYGLPELVGTDGQIQWAETCRWNLINVIQSVIDEAVSSAQDDAVEEECALGFQHLCAETSASWWIDNREMSYRKSVLQLIASHAQMAREKVVKEVIEAPVEQEITLRPAEPKTESVAEIKVSDKKVEVIFREYRADFREIIRQLHFEWSGNCWVRDITSLTGAAHDRAAEAGHLLLASGFILRIADLAIREKAISGDYVPEHTRWVQVRTSGNYTGWFAIVWSRSDENYYNPARSIPGARWSNPFVVVPPEQFEAIMDFASMYDFKISNAAKKIIQSAREAKERALLVDIKPPARKAGRSVALNEDGVPILEVPKEVVIDESLRDDD